MGKLKKLRVSFFVLLLSIFCLSIVFSPNVFAEEKSVGKYKTAPLSPEFLKWLNEREKDNNSSKSNASSNKYAKGYHNSIKDFSHLEKNPPQTRKDFAVSLPSKYDLRDYNRVPSAVKNQNPFGSCWAHAAIGAMESSYMTQNFTSLGTEPDLSELHMAWFVYKDPEEGHSFPLPDTNKCVVHQGSIIGTEDSAYFGRMAGPVAESSMPYDKAGKKHSESDGLVSSFVGNKKPKDFPTVLKMKARYDIGVVNSYNRDTVKEMIMRYGAMKIGYWAGEDDYEYSLKNERSWFQNNDTLSNHAVLIIGWDDNYSTENFDYPRPQKNGAWLAKNSWGENFGNGGYFYISYEQYITDAKFFIADKYSANEIYYGYDVNF